MARNGIHAYIPGITVYNLLVMITLQYSTIGDLNSQLECVFCHISRHRKNDLLCLHENNYENILLVLVSADDSSLF